MKKRRLSLPKVIVLLIVVALVSFAIRRHNHVPPEHPEIITVLPHDYKTTGQKYPLIVFSHGYLGCPKQSAFLTRGLTQRGFIVVAPRHRDATCGNDEANKFVVSFLNMPFVTRDKASFFQPQEWTDTTNQSRRDDIVYTIDNVLADPELAPYIDADKIGVMGHSFGGYTALGVAGAWPSWKDTRIKAALILTPYVAPYLADKNVAAIDIPVMYQAGSEDRLTPAWMVKTAYQLHEGKTPRHYVELAGAGHLDWMDLGDKEPRRAIISYAKAFFNQYLSGEESLPLDVPKDEITYLAQ